MITLGTYNGGDDNAAVVVSGGAVVSAVHAAGPGGRTGLSPSALRALDAAGLRAADVDAVLTTGDSSPTAGGQFVGAAVAQAAQLRAIVPGDSNVLVVDDGDAGSAAIVRLTRASHGEPSEVAGAQALLAAVRTVAGALGLPCHRPIEALESIARADDASSLPSSVTHTGGRLSATLDLTAVKALVEGLHQRCPSPADIASSSHVDVIRMRAVAAASTLEGLADVIAAVAERVSEDGRSCLAGRAFTSPEFIARVRRRVDAAVAPVPDAFGCALGAALISQSEVRPLTHLALGQAFTEADIKAALENCRLDYVYEPDWHRLYVRVSELLETGALVGWFQGRADFSRHSFGSRSILCDPSRRYSRENVNTFLLNRPVHAPLPLSVTAAAAPAVADAASSLDYAAFTSHEGRQRRHVAAPDAVPEFYSLLRAHHERTQVGGLLNIPMLAGTVLAPAPRDAIRETFASATDALVIGRFLVAKDYWLLRRRVTDTPSR